MLESVLWYSRYSVWVGAIVLLLQAITGRSIGVITLLAVLLLGGGFLAFVAVLGWDGLGLTPRSEPVPIEDAFSAGTQAARPERPAIRAPETRPVAPPLPTAEPSPPTPGPRDAAVAQDQAQSVEPAPTASTAVRLATQALEAGSPLVGASCTACAKRLRAGQVVVRCPECGAVQHASCWTDNGFACGVEDCTGRGGLEAPVGI